MSPNSGLTAAGSSTYASNTLHVGDGTWDSDRDTFLLPNLMGVNFETMKYNGEWTNRTRALGRWFCLDFADQKNRHGKPISRYA